MDVHGNVLYMHCSKDCSEKMFFSPSIDSYEAKEKKVPVCKDCGENMKPHCMFFDE